MLGVVNLATVDDESCGEEKNHEEHIWDVYLGEHGLGVVSLNCPGVDVWQQ
jgi:hypothetical protein